MKKILFLLITFSLTTLANNLNEEHQHSHHQHHSHEGHMHEMLVDGKKLEVDPIRFDRFVENLSNAQIAVVDVNGMVCDFCARGVEKAFAKDPDVMKIDVDLELGSVLIAYGSEAQPSERDINKRIRPNGLDVVDIEIYRG